VPFETNFTAQIKKGKDLTRKLLAVCSMPEYAFLLEPSPNSSNPFIMKGYNSTQVIANVDNSMEPDENNNSFGINKARIPFLRRIYGLILVDLATPNYLRGYEKRVPAANSSSQTKSAE
jgi:hypothetical protein